MGHGKRMQEVQTNALVPVCVTWSTQKVANWLDKIGYGVYKECFLNNFINGRKLIILEADKLPRIGITDFTHIKGICEEIRHLLRQPEADYQRSISLPHKDCMGLFLEEKARTGNFADNISYSNFLKRNAKKLNQFYGTKTPSASASS